MSSLLLHHGSVRATTEPHANRWSFMPVFEATRVRGCSGTCRALGADMKVLIKTLATVALGAVLGSSGFALAQKSNAQVREASPYVAIENEPPAELVVDPPLAEPLSRGLVQVQYRAANLHIVPVIGKAALSVSPRVGHLHVTVDDLPWHWADVSNSNTVDVAELPAGRHKLTIDLVDANHQHLATQAVTFTVPETHK
jgi:hypothetical protein